MPLVKAIVLMAALHIHIHLHHQFHGPTIDYLGLALAAFSSFATVPGPGESVLIAESIFAAKHNLGIAEVIVVATAGATMGGIVGWLVGLKAGRAIVTAPGPFARARARAVEHGEQVFERHAVLAIYLTPSWVAGIHRVRPWIFIATTFVSAIFWATSVGLGAYFLGPVIVDFLSDLGVVTGGALGVLVVGSVIAEVLRRRRHRARTPSDEKPGDQGRVTTPSPPTTH